MQKYTEQTLIEQPAIELFNKLVWDTANCFNEFEQAGKSLLAREPKSVVVLISHLSPTLQKLNLVLLPEAIQHAINELVCNLLLPKLISGYIDNLDIKVRSLDYE